MPAVPPPARALWAYAGPFGVFALLLALPGLVGHPPPPALGPEFWVYPLQTLVCGAMLFHFRHEYPRAFGPVAAVWGIVAGLAVFVLWVSPQAFFHAAPRVGEGFNPMLAGTGWFCTATVAWRFARLVIVVPLVEEIFWRGFLLRYLIKEEFLALPFGAWTPLSFAVTTIGFTLEHTRPDWPTALITGILYNLVAIRTRSLPACVLAHALTNLCLGIYVMQTRQWGFW